MREYDGIEVRYRRPDADLAKSLQVIENLLGFAPELQQLDFDLSFWAGGAGVLDKLAISCNVSPAQWLTLKQKLDLYSPEEMIAREDCREDFIWLVADDEECGDILAASAQFINDNKAPFQGTCDISQSIHFGYMSDVNTWTAVWRKGSRINYAYFCQG
ncbi:hypothetical protein [Shewanella mangrovisoli]|uniref:hypothetical protein n=1 Tax=Shewanella mangrovisoli TaxID=2864211 RepID=UPI001C65C581|nr:hypothetical protein [Shewanella mangrovisoli]QYK08781.1 hypothetical protein K0H60_18550 [Shewanella mangrovisoli]